MGKLTLLTIALGVGLSAVATAPVPAAYGVPIAQEPASSCDPNYSGACVPIASDVDCAGGSGNGPAYVSGPVTVVGQDIYDLDRDGNGTGCE
ncbi:excalibur domain-containing protein [Mycolicibacterium mengxianglii]|uniref:excalibur domain-containing protein n=1 Tax=Mycolicibacterium mengxianglii TaxID=2736649 RepID=UPI0038CBF7CF